MRLLRFESFCNSIFKNKSRLETKLNRRICIALVIVSGNACAQSSVTLFGRVDAGIQYLSGVAGQNGARSGLWSADSGDDGASAWGLFGSEDIGGGYKVNFKLVDYMSLMTGQSFEPFWPVAYVGMSGPFGSFRLGSDDSILKDGAFDYDPFYQQAIGMESLVRGANWPNVTNTIGYYSPSFGGFDVAAQYSLGGVPGNFNSGRSDSLQLTYRLGAFSARTIYQELRDEKGQFSDLFDAQKQLFFGVAFTGTLFKVQFAYTYMAAPRAPATSPRYADYGWAGVTYNSPGALKVMTGVAHIHQRDGHGSATLVAVGPTYNLSKSTYLYTTAGYVINGKNTNFSPIAQPVGSAFNPALGRNQFGFYSGIMHYF